MGIGHALNLFRPILVIFGWLSKLWSLLGVLIIIRHLILRVPSRGHSFDNYPFGLSPKVSSVFGSVIEEESIWVVL